MKQLDLLEWTPPRKVIVFPMMRRHGKVQHVANVLERKHGRAADGYWKQTVSALLTQLERAGVFGDEASEYIRDFHDAVQAELQQRWLRQSKRPGGDAA